jgi:hypothetical protein
LLGGAEVFGKFVRIGSRATDGEQVGAVHAANRDAIHLDPRGVAVEAAGETLDRALQPVEARK